MKKPSWKTFHSATKIKALPASPPDTRTWPDSWNKTFYKGYARLPETLLPKPGDLGPISLRDSMLKRKSLKSFSASPLDLQTIGDLLYYSAGTHEDKTGTTRFYPSAGARYPLETYLLNFNSDLAKGVYHYYLKRHSLEFLTEFKMESFGNYWNQPWFRNAGAIIIMTALFNRTVDKYGDRGYRHILIEAGHLGQNIYLASVALGLGCCAIGGYVDRNIEKLLDIDGETESVVYMVAVGKKK